MKHCSSLLEAFVSESVYLEALFLVTDTRGESETNNFMNTLAYITMHVVPRTHYFMVFLFRILNSDRQLQHFEIKRYINIRQACIAGDIREFNHDGDLRFKTLFIGCFTYLL